MLGALLPLCLACLAPQAPAQVSPQLSTAEAVAVRGEAELTPAEAFASARRKAEQHVRERWLERADRALARQRTFWLPDALARPRVERWVEDLPLEQFTCLVDREDLQREHEFGSSYQTTLWITEEPRRVRDGEQQLRRHLQRLRHTMAVRYGSVVAGWVVIAVAIGWIDRLSRGYMTGRLRFLGLLAGAAVPALAFLV